MDIAGDRRPPSLITLKELIPLKPWQTPPPPLSQIQYGKYRKVKDGARVFWAPGTVGMRELDDDTNIIAYEGFFEFIDRVVINKVRLWIDKVLGEILGLPKYDGEHSRFRREPLLL